MVDRIPDLEQYGLREEGSRVLFLELCVAIFCSFH